MFKKSSLSLIFIFMAYIMFCNNVNAAVRSVGSDTNAMEATEAKSCWQQGFRAITCPGGACSSCYDKSNKKTYYKKIECNTIGYVSSCPSGQVLDPSTKLSCNTSYSSKCICDTNIYKYTTDNCSNELGGETCILDGKTYHKTCDCSSKYSKTCSGDYVPANAGDSCGGKYKSCICNPSIFKFSTCTNGPDIGAKTCVEENGSNKYTSCKLAPKTCVDFGYVSSCPVGQTGDVRNLTPFGLVCYTNCKAPPKTCTEANPLWFDYLTHAPDFVDNPDFLCSIEKPSGLKCLSCEDHPCGLKGFKSICPAGHVGTPKQIVASSGDKFTCYEGCKELTCQEFVATKMANLDPLLDKVILSDRTFSKDELLWGRYLGPKFFSDHEPCKKMNTPLIVTHSPVFGPVEFVGLEVQMQLTRSDWDSFTECDSHLTQCYDNFKYYGSDYSYCVRKSYEYYYGIYEKDISVCTENDASKGYFEKCCSFINKGLNQRNNVTVRDSEIWLTSGTGVNFFTAYPSILVVSGTSTIITDPNDYIYSSYNDTDAYNALIIQGGNVNFPYGKVNAIREEWEVLDGTIVNFDRLYLDNDKPVMDTDNKNLTISGEVYIDWLFLRGGRVIVNKTGFLGIDKLEYNINGGEIIYEAGARIQLGPHCKRMTNSGKIPSHTNSLEHLPGVRC